MKWFVLLFLCGVTVLHGGEREEKETFPFESAGRKVDPNSPVFLKQQISLHEKRAKLLEREASRLLNVDFTMYRFVLRQRDDEYQYIQYLQEKFNMYPFVKE